jgi:hypothetical protein
VADKENHHAQAGVEVIQLGNLLAEAETGEVLDTLASDREEWSC